MPCDTVLKKGQTVSERAAEVRKAGQEIDRLLAAGRVKVKVGPQGAVTFLNIPEDVRAGITDACVYRRIMASGSHSARQAIAQAERLAGRAVDKKVVATGIHSHDGGQTWHPRG
ncbi:hypothetical protein SEA_NIEBRUSAYLOR_93 [Mycobacterium phage NiebruSaylor]|uniref:Uncharacterized protein n=7 Tax=Viruses TaxID=10239 RepID=Q856K1_BPMCO|nr:gp93 [Mycobacterium phage Corndog]YP_008409262.1 hypothetical protein PBI_CATDAWG_93 [Mycobacterium phage Catdawg]YP_008530656.1 hypothetical protein PBI_DYLAN_92 [Mycobacterium phage Dylan]YP_009014460.1 hypothetical protein CL96_gp097 [Mycobacterium phage Firecracker]AII28333.1 hypothetical protein PBI_YUNGJAMAL_94 [Mycobacterium phage YungJamal]ALA48934.1 hypothetical protein ZAKHE101_92 [Mycobacterium phage Zakhe101]ATW60576.1 hypothetical protein SEA_FAMILTON_94 [Mycobacterium phage F